MSGNSQTQDGRSEQAAEQRRRKRKERAAKARTPEPKDIVSGAGQPLDTGVRRELEEQLGHDLGRVRLHTGRDAGQLTELLGADAVAVGQDIFFREGAYRPGTADGRRLLAHELLHTVQNPDGLGALRAGRDLGAVSLPQQAIEREAESAAQDLVRPEAGHAVRPGAGESGAAGLGTGVDEGQATPGWLRYATVDADRNRMERIDPATLVDRLTNSVVRSLRGDPEDLSKRTRKQLARLPEELLDGVLAHLESRLLSSEHERVLDLVEETDAEADLGVDAVERTALDAPDVEPDAAEDMRFERESEQRAADEEQLREQRPALAPGPEKDSAEREAAPGSTPQNGGTAYDGTTPQGAGAPRGGQGERPPGAEAERRPGADAQQRPGTEAGGGTEAASSPSPAPAGAQQPEGPAAAQQSSAAQGEKAAGATDGGQQADGGRQEDGGQRTDGGKQAQGGEKAAGEKDGKAAAKGEGGKEGADQQGTPTASKEESAAKNRPGAAEQFAAGQQLKKEDKGGSEKPSGSPGAAGRDTQLPGRSSRLDGVRNQDLEGPEDKADEDPFGSGSESEVEAGGEEKSAWDTKLQPDDFLPEQDLDVSGVPTADKLDPSAANAAQAPSFPAPPVTKADKVQAERDAEDAEDEAAEAEYDEEGADAPAEPAPSVETEGGPGDDRLGGPDAERAAESRPGQSNTSKDPKSGDDPKAGPVVAQTTVQEAPGKTEGGKAETGGAAKESAAKEEKGAPAAGDKAGAAQEKGSQQAAVGKAAAPETAGKGEQPKDASGGAGGSEAGSGTEPAGTSESAGRSEPTDDAKAPSASRDSHVTGGANADKPGSSTSGTQSGASSDTDRSTQSSQEEAPRSSQAPEPNASAPAPKAPEAPAPKAPEAPASTPASAPKEEREPKAAAAPKAAPAPKASPGGGGGGGGGKSSAKGKGKKDSGPAPNLSQVSPEAGLSTAAKLKPHKALQAMGGVGGAVDRTVGDEHKQLASAPPSMQRPAGAPQTLEGKPKADAPARYSQDPAKKSDAPEQEKAEVKDEKKPEGQIEAEKAEEPGGWDTFMMGLGFVGGKLVNGVASLFGADEPVVDPQALAAKFAGLPTKDEALKEAQAGNAPGVEMKGAADEKAGEQGQSVDTKGQEAVATGRDDAGRPMGEDQVYPDAPKEQLQGKVPGREGGKGGGVPGGGASTGAVPAEAASEVAEHDRGPQVQAAFSQGQKGVSESRQTKDRDFRDSQQKHKRQVDGEVEKNTATQADERAKAEAEVGGQRTDWRKEQDEELKKLGTKKTDRNDKIRKDVKEREEKTDDDVTKEKTDSDKKIQDKATKAESDAKTRTDTAAEDSGNWVSKAFDWIKQKVIEIKNAIVRIIREARDAVVNFIKNFKDNVERWINEARKFIVDAVKNLINDLIEFATAMVKAVIDLANRIRKFITDLIATAIAFVTKLAARLRQIVTDLLNAIAKVLSDILNILKKMLMDVIKAVVDAVKTVLEYASKLLGALGEFMMVAVDFLSDPGGWLSGAKNSAVDGAKNHLFREVQAAVKQWFQSKIEEIIGVPKAIIDKLIKGGFTLEKIVKETWDAIVPQLPFIIGEIVITKVIAKLIPGAGWVMAVIDAIRTAIGALGEILRAMGAVLDWLKAVRQGGAGVLFAKAVAAGIVALLELAYEALLSGIGKYVAKVGRRLKGVAAKLGGDKGKGDGKAPAGQGGDGRGGDKDTPANKPAANVPPVRPTTTPKPGTRPDLNKPKDDASGTTRPKDTDGKNPAKPGQPKMDKPGTKPGGSRDTRPTPTPKRETQPKPKSGPDPKPRDSTPSKPNDTDGKIPDKPKDQDSNKPKDDVSGTTKPKDADAKTPGKPKEDKDGLDRPKAGKDAPGTRKPKDTDGKKPKHGKDLDGKKPEGKKPKDRDGRGPKKPKHSQSGKPERDPEKERQDKKEERKKEEDSKESKDARLRKIVAKIRPRIDSKLRKGLNAPLMRLTLAGMRAWYRLSSLAPEGSTTATVQARLNPELSASEKHKIAKQLQLHRELDDFADRQAGRPTEDEKKKQEPLRQDRDNEQTGKGARAEQAEGGTKKKSGESTPPLLHVVNPHEPLLVQAVAVHEVLSGAKRGKRQAILQHGAEGPSVRWSGGFPHDPGGFLSLSDGDVRYQDARLAAKRMKDVKGFLAGVDAIQRGDLKAAVATGQDMQKMMEFAYLRGFIESRRDPTMTTFAQSEIGWAARVNSEAAARQQFDDVLGRGMMTHNRNVKLAKDMRQIARHVVPNGEIDMNRMDDTKVKRLLRAPAPGVLKSVHENETNWATKAGQRAPEKEETETSKETGRQRLDRMTLWFHRMAPSDLHVTYDGYEEHLARMQQILEEIMDADPDVLQRAPKLWTP
ncbi:eCIS core domain-containing protein [Streptomyces sp. 2A115]|uniref:eCIS core domain-containing protein n=1 Tax=Streptomyces sp. 2A115 TaxID=3457439 RepID=UPI003FD370AF